MSNKIKYVSAKGIRKYRLDILCSEEWFTSLFNANETVIFVTGTTGQVKKQISHLQAAGVTILRVLSQLDSNWRDDFKKFHLGKLYPYKDK